MKGLALFLLLACFIHVQSIPHILVNGGGFSMPSWGVQPLVMPNMVYGDTHRRVKPSPVASKPQVTLTQCPVSNEDRYHRASSHRCMPVYDKVNGHVFDECRWASSDLRKGCLRIAYPKTMSRQEAVWFCIGLVHERRRDVQHTARDCDEDPTLFARWVHAFGDGNPMHWSNYSGPDGSESVQVMFPI